MAQQYLLPCECGKATPVTVAQAGRTLPCDCGREQKVPTLAGLRQLEPVSSSLAKDQPAAWNTTRGAMFVVGLILAMAGLAVGSWGSYVLRHIDVKAIQEYEDEVEAIELGQIDHMTPIQAYEVWQKIREMGPGPADSTHTLHAQRAYDYYLRMALIGFAIAAVGILMAAGSLIQFSSQRPVKG